MAFSYYVYIIKCGDGTLYTGYTDNLEARLSAHREGKGAKYTRGRGPFELVFQEEFTTKATAMKKERQIQKLQRSQKQRLISESREK